MFKNYKHSLHHIRKRLFPLSYYINETFLRQRNIQSYRYQTVRHLILTVLCSCITFTLSYIPKVGYFLRQLYEIKQCYD